LLILRFSLNKGSVVTSAATSTPGFTRKLHDTRIIRRTKSFRARSQECVGATKAHNI
jgi:hypothetical protein